MSKKKIKARYETYYTLTPAACDALGIQYDEQRPVSLKELMQANQQMEGIEKCSQQTDQEDSPPADSDQCNRSE